MNFNVVSRINAHGYTGWTEDFYVCFIGRVFTVNSDTKVTALYCQDVFSKDQK